MTPVLAEILGPDLLILLAVVLVLFGGSRLPQLARSLGSAKREFEAGISEGSTEAGEAGEATDPGPSPPH
jgi:sec-independent protein translocase protein TatA